MFSWSTAFAEQFARLEKLVPPAALAALVAASHAEVDEFQNSEMSYRLVRDDVLTRSALGRALAARGITGEGAMAWIVLSAYQRRGRGEAVDVEALIEERQAAIARYELSEREKRERQRRTGIVVTACQMDILDHISFDRGQAAIRAETMPLLDAVARMLDNDLGIRLLEVRGHAASNERNPRALAALRADAVRARLLARGVAPERLVTMSAGTESGRYRGCEPEGTARNRCVDFVILRRVPQKQD
jgi:outer membrane protein OmpA-like peptidoglycan-associated protein